MRFGALLLTLGAAGVLAACASSPTSRFYTLNGTSAVTAASAASTQPASYYLELAPVDMPQQVARNQLVVQTSAAQVSVLETERWASLPGDEVRRALSADLTQRLGAIDVYGTGRPDTALVYRVKVAVQRFESWPGSQAVIDAVWSVHASGSQAVLTCRTVAREPVATGYDALVDGHRKAVGEIASAISAGVRSLNALPPTAPTTAAANGKTAVPARAPLLPCPSASVSTTAATQ